MILFFDTETTGFVRDDLPLAHEVQPRLVELGLYFCEDDGTPRSSARLVVKPAGFEIPQKASDVHGITTDIAMRVGIPSSVALGCFLNFRALASELVAYNLPFDTDIMDIEIERSGRQPSHPGPDKKTCAMRLATPICAMPPTDKMKALGFDKFKPPKLSEAIKILFGEELPGAHSALADAMACARIFFHLQEAKAP